jgi:dephospho-CoA kinase
MYRIGLTGGIGSGKSTISAYLKELGFQIVDADQVAREVLDIYPEILEFIRNEFGEGFFNENGTLNRRKLGDFLFCNRDKLEKYEAVILPFIKKEIFSRLEKLENSGLSVCFLDAPTLIEAGMHKLMDKNILVWVDRETQIERVTKRDSMEYAQIMGRISSQMDLDKKKEMVDFVVDNSAGIEEAKREVREILAKLGLIKGAI